MTKYEELQHKVVDLLRDVGVWFSYNDRLPLFTIRSWLIRSYLPMDHGKMLLETIDELVKLRTEGKEPEHKEGEYGTKDSSSGTTGPS